MPAPDDLNAISDNMALVALEEFSPAGGPWRPDDIADMQRAINAALKAGDSVVVPREPTDSMMTSALNVRAKNGSFKDMMAAMLAAAPKGAE